MANPAETLAKFQAGEPLSRPEMEEVSLHVQILQLGELEHLCIRLSRLLEAQGVEMSLDGQPPSPNGGAVASPGPAEG